MNIRLRELTAHDIKAIGRWPPYPPEFGDLDYALRNGGWLADFGGGPDIRYFAVEQAGCLIAFTLLAKTGEDEAEFRIALRAGRIGQGLGGVVTALTLDEGFGRLCLSRIHLIVRENNHRAARLYARLGFVGRGACRKTVNGKQAHFLLMELPKASYSKRTKAGALCR